MGGSERVDSLLFGTARTPEIAAGTTSGWLTLPNGLARLRVLARSDPSADQLASRAEKLRREELERRLSTYFEDLKRRYPVRILDARLRELDVPRPPDPKPGR